MDNKTTESPQPSKDFWTKVNEKTNDDVVSIISDLQLGYSTPQSSMDRIVRRCNAVLELSQPQPSKASPTSGEPWSKAFGVGRDFAVEQRSEPRGQQQEWTTRELDFGFWGLFAGDIELSREFHNETDANKVRDAHNAERKTFNNMMITISYEIFGLENQLVTERQLRELAELDYKICCTMRDNHAKQLEIVLPIRVKLEDQLLSALAAIEKHNKDDHTEGCYLITDIDLSALHEHDAQVRKPLVEALEHCEKLIKMLAGSLDGKWHNNTLAWDACKEKGWLADALAKVKEGK